MAKATNNRGVDNELQELFLKHEDDLRENLQKMKVQFQFIPPNAPHHGGTWESMVKLIKRVLHY